MSFKIWHADQSRYIIIQDYTSDNSTSLTLSGRGVSNYGVSFASNFLHLLENSANNSPPLSPVTGQLWYDTSARALKVFDGTWNELSGVDGFNTGRMHQQSTANLRRDFTTESAAQNHAASQLTSKDIAAAIGDSLTVNGIISSNSISATRINSTNLSTTDIHATNIILEANGSIKFPDGSVFSSAPIAISFSPPLQHSDNSTQSTKNIKIGWDGLGLTLHTDSTQVQYLVTSSTNPVLTLRPTASAGMGGKICFSNSSPGEDLFIDAWSGKTANNNLIRMYRGNLQVPVSLSFNCDTGVISSTNLVTSEHNVNDVLSSLVDQVNTLNINSKNYLDKTGSNDGLSGQIGSWLGDFSGITSYDNIFASQALIAPTLHSQNINTVTINSTDIITTSVQASGPISSSSFNALTGDIVSSAGRIRAALGATGSDDLNTVTLLSDFFADKSGNGHMMFPNGIMIQWFLVSLIGDGNTRVLNFPTAFPSFCAMLWSNYGDKPHHLPGTVVVSTQAGSPYQYRAYNNTGSFSEDICSVMALGW